MINPMAKFRAVMRHYLDQIKLDIMTPDEAEDFIAQAADTLLEDMAIEMAEGTTAAFTGLLLGVYQRGKYPGDSANPSLNELLRVVAEAGERKEKGDADDQATHDTY